MANLTYPQWFKKCLFRSKSLKLYSCAISASLDIKCFQPLSQRLCFFPDSYNFISSAISQLFFSCSPPAVRFAIWPVIVNPIKSQRVRITRKHVISKRNKRTFPRITYGHTPSSVILIRCIVSIIASILHSLPNMVKACSRHTMFCASRCSNFFIIAPTTNSRTVNETVTINYRFFATIAYATNHHLSLFVFSFNTFCDKATESLAYYVDNFTLSHNVSFKLNDFIYSHYTPCKHEVKEII